MGLGSAQVRGVASIGRWHETSVRGSLRSMQARRVTRTLRRRGLIQGELELQQAAIEPAAEPVSAIEGCLQAGLSPGTFERIRGQAAVNDNKGEGDHDEQFDHRKASPWSGEADGFSVHAGTRMAEGDAAGRERLIRYCARPCLSLERMSMLQDGRVAYRVKQPRRNGTTHRVMAPLELLVRVAALIPPPRFPLVRYSGVLAPASKWRPLVVPKAVPKPLACVPEKPSPEPASRRTEADRGKPSGSQRESTSKGICNGSSPKQAGQG